jgi:hypothetical protein
MLSLKALFARTFDFTMKPAKAQHCLRFLPNFLVP